MSLRLHCLQHADHEGPANFALWAKRGGHDLQITRAYAGDRLPAADTLDWLVVLGGAVNTRDVAEYPWLLGEKRLIGEAVRTGKKVLGICLGAQLLAESLGASVKKNKVAEIGWFSIRLTAEGKRHPWLIGTPEELPVFHWHEDTFDLPAGGVRLAANAACDNQAFVIGNQLLGLQFHPEVSAREVTQWLADPTSALPSGPFVQTPDAMSQSPHFAPMERWFSTLLDHFASS